jgi:hypothetical protein
MIGDFRLHDGQWWKFSYDRPERPLTQAEIDWHVRLRHKPFVPDGIDFDHPDYWGPNA